MRVHIYLVRTGKRGLFSKRICHSLVQERYSRKVTLTIYRILIIVTIHFHNDCCNRTERFTRNPHAWWNIFHDCWSEEISFPVCVFSSCRNFNSLFNCCATRDSIFFRLL